VKSGIQPYIPAGDTVNVTLTNNLNANPGTTTTMNTMHSPGGAGYKLRMQLTRSA
jgi:hypothetical protein